MLKKKFFSVVFAAFALNAQSRVELLQRAADFYKALDTFDVKGSASAKIAGTSWQVSYDVETAAAQPQFVPVGLRTSSLQSVTKVSNFHSTRVVAGTRDPLPSRGFGMLPFGRFADLTRRLLDAQRVGSETLTYQGHEYTCEIIDAEYDASPEFKPNSRSSHKRVYINPQSLWVLKEAQPDDAVGEWTFVVTSMAFNEALTDASVRALQSFVNQPKARSEWVGRNMPDVTLTDLSGNRVSLSNFRGEPLLLDFWASYCGPCKGATALAQELAKTYQQDGLRVWTLTQDTPSDARAWLAFNHVSLPALLDTEGTAFKALDVPGVPVAILVDDHGKVVKYWTGMEDKSDVQSTVESLMHRPRGERH